MTHAVPPPSSLNTDSCSVLHVSICTPLPEPIFYRTAVPSVGTDSRRLAIDRCRASAGAGLGRACLLTERTMAVRLSIASVRTAICWQPCSVQIIGRSASCLDYSARLSMGLRMSGETRLFPRIHLPSAACQARHCRFLFQMHTSRCSSSKALMLCWRAGNKAK